MTTEALRAVPLPHVAHGEPDGSPVVLLHGISDSHRSFEPLLACLPSSIRAHAVTVRGHGDAPKPEAGYEVRQLAGDVVAFMDECGIERAVVAGHSMSSIIAARLAIDAPDRVSGIVLMGSRPNFGELDELRQEIEAFDDSVDREWVREFQLSTLARPVPDDFLEMVIDESMKLPPRVWKALVAGALDVDQSAELGAITAPTLLAWGDEDVICLRPHQDELLGLIPQARLRVYEGGGHAFHWEDPRSFARDLHKFVSDVALRAL